MAIDQNILDELTKVCQVIDRTLVASLGAETTFSESPAAGKIVAICNPDRWNRLNRDLVQISGNIWVITGGSGFLEIRARVIDLSARMAQVERDIRYALQDPVQVARYLSPDITIVENRNGQFSAWPLEITARESNAHQEAPWTGQIRPGFELNLVIKTL